MMRMDPFALRSHPTFFLSLAHQYLLRKVDIILQIKKDAEYTRIIQIFNIETGLLTHCKPTTPYNVGTQVQ